MLKTINGRCYIYRSERVGGRVVTRYIGPLSPARGPAAEELLSDAARSESIARLERALAQRPSPGEVLRACRRARLYGAKVRRAQTTARRQEEVRRHVAELEDRRREREEQRALKARLAAQMEALDVARAPLDAAARAAEEQALLAAGWVRHNRSWRRGNMTTENSAEHRTNPTPAAPPPKMTRAERVAAEDEARLADKKAKREAKAAAARQHAADLETYRSRLKASDAPQLVKQSRAMNPPAAPWAAALSDDAATQALTEREAELLAEELAGPGASAAVRLLAERCALDTLALKVWEGREVSATRYCEGLDAPDRYLKIADKLHRRLRQSVMALERVKAVGAAVRVMNASTPRPPPKCAPIVVMAAPSGLIH